MNKNEVVEKYADKKDFTFDDLCSIMMFLRADGGCPWDMEQTHESIRRDFIEETYEVIEAIDKKDSVLMCEELGDVLMQVVFHAEIEREKDSFNIGNVINGICEKLITRHPHVFGDSVIKNSDDVLKNWDRIKNNEKQRNTVTSRLRSVPQSLPALMKAEKVGKRAKVFDFPDAQPAFSKVEEETFEVKEAMEKGDKAALTEEIGDLLFSVANLARKSGIDPEQALVDATEKFVCRFEKIENEIVKSGKDIQNVKIDELDTIWNKIKSQDIQNNKK